MNFYSPGIYRLKTNSGKVKGDSIFFSVTGFKVGVLLENYFHKNNSKMYSFFNSTHLTFPFKSTKDNLVIILLRKSCPRKDVSNYFMTNGNKQKTTRFKKILNSESCILL